MAKRGRKPRPKTEPAEAAFATEPLASAAEKPVYTLTELCRRWHTSRRILLIRVAEGKLAAFRLGERMLRVTAAEVARVESEAVRDVVTR